MLVQSPSERVVDPEMVCLVVIATGLYVEFLPSLVTSASKHVKDLGQVFVLTERDPNLGSPVRWLPWGHMAWPYATLLRYRALCAYRDILEAEDVLLHVDADMRFVDDVDIGGLEGTMAVQHPGYVSSSPTDFPYERRSESLCYIPVGHGEQYYAGGVQGGRADSYLLACARMADWIHEDLSKGIVPTWHDESAWNKNCHLHPPTLTLPARYCSPEYSNDPEAIIVALDKDHDRVRQAVRRNRTMKHAIPGRALFSRALRYLNTRIGM
jgi:hypothetical protein